MMEHQWNEISVLLLARGEETGYVSVGTADAYI